MSRPGRASVTWVRHEARMIKFDMYYLHTQYSHDPTPPAHLPVAPLLKNPRGRRDWTGVPVALLRH
jgi:hypothetical protein